MWPHSADLHQGQCVTNATHYTLDARTVVRHRAGRVVAFDASSIGHSFPASDGPKANETRVLAQGPGPKLSSATVAVVSIMGPLAQRAETFCSYIDGYDSIADRVCSALNDPDVGAVVLRIDSPGGDVAGIEEAIRTIVECRDRSGKQIATYVDELAASGAYWLAASLSNAGIFAPKSGRVGSIGCYTVFVDEREALAKDGLAVRMVRDPGGKDAANPIDPVADLALARMQDEVTGIALRFYSAVSASRGIPVETVRSLNAAVLGAESAKTAGLIDDVATFDGVLGRVAAPIPNQIHAASRSGRQKVSTRGKIMGRSRVAEGDAPARATTTEVASSCRECEAACGDCATACESGTADEAIAGAQACREACKANIAVLDSFLGSPADKPEPEEMPDGDPAAPMPEESAAAASLMRTTGKASLVQALEQVEAWKASALEHQAAQAKLEQERKALETEERRGMVASLVKGGFETPATAWADDKGTVPAEHLAAMSLPALRDRVAKLTGSRSPAPARVSPPTASESDEIPERLRGKVDPAKYAATRAAIAARKVS
jgi:capsid assembly protease